VRVSTQSRRDRRVDNATEALAAWIRLKSYYTMQMLLNGSKQLLFRQSASFLSSVISPKPPVAGAARPDSALLWRCLTIAGADAQAVLAFSLIPSLHHFFSRASDISDYLNFLKACTSTDDQFNLYLRPLFLSLHFVRFTRTVFFSILAPLLRCARFDAARLHSDVARAWAANVRLVPSYIRDALLARPDPAATPAPRSGRRSACAH
jgi:hypothetical protein